MDTNVLFAGLYSTKGASHQVLRAIQRGSLRLALSTPLLFEYEEVLKRKRRLLDLSDAAIDKVLDALCQRSDHHRIHFLWRPQLPDARDDHILELAISSSTGVIATHNKKDFREAKRFGIRVLSPQQLLKEIQ